MAVGHMIGRTISHYRIVEKIGAGGMGMVFRAYDEKLERDVAIKFLPLGLLTDAAARRRFRKEALTLAKVHHPNIGTIYEFGSEEGRDYLVMEYIPGATLAERLAAGPLGEKEAVAIGCQIAAALEEAHEQGVIHCDLKPANVMITPKGQVKILDFGIARLASKVTDETSTTTSSADEPGLMTGTVPYMAPEQLFDETSDARTDIHAFGALLYEMVTGRRAFPGSFVPSITDAILHGTPMRPAALISGISPEIERIILKCLEKSPDDRYQSAKELCIDLRRLATPSTGTVRIAVPRLRNWRRRWAAIGAAFLVAVLAALAWTKFGQRARAWLGIDAAAPVRSLAVLPVQNVSGDPGQDFYADGMTSALAGELEEIHALRVISAGSAMPLKANPQSLKQVAQQLNIDAVIAATVQRSGNRVHLNVRLLRPSDNAQLWEQSYDFDAGDSLRVVHAVVNGLARRARVPLTPAERLDLTVNPKADPAAEDSYLEGLAGLAIPTEDSLAKARAAFQRAILLDNDYAPAYAGLAEAYVLCACPGRQRASVMTKAKEAALRALELNENLADAHAALGYVHMSYDYDWLAAQRELKRAIALNPNSAEARRFYGELLVAMTRLQEGIASMRRAVDLDPLSAPANASLGIALSYAREDEASVEQFQKALQLDPRCGLAHTGLGRAFLQMGQYGQAAAQFQQAIALGYDVPGSTARLAQTYALTGSREEARKTAGDLARLRGPNEPPAYTLALVYAALGDKPAALHWLEKARQARDPDLRYVKVDSSLDALRIDPRFQAVLLRMSFP